jgi:spore maturation protein CgeB
VVCGLSITSSWGNGHATTYRALLKQFAARGHRVTFLERDVPWYRENRDYPKSEYCDVRLYADLAELRTRYSRLVHEADAVIVGSYVPDGVEVIRWVLDRTRGITAFYDIDTPVTVANLKARRCEYLIPDLIPAFDLYLSFTGGPILNELESRFGAARAHLLACSVDPDLYYPEPEENRRWEMGYLGTYSADRQPKVETLLLEPAAAFPTKQFVLAGPLYPETLSWPGNLLRIPHLPPTEHRRFYNGQRWTLNVTRGDMVAVGYSPSVRLFEAAACGTPIISDLWVGLEDFFRPGEEILVARNTEQCCAVLRECSDTARKAISRRARERVLSEHSAAHRARELERLLLQSAGVRRRGIARLASTEVQPV